MAYACVVRTAKLSSLAAVRGSGKHTWRESETPNSDPERRELNTDLRPISSSYELVEAVSKRLALATDMAAKEPVICLEYLITANNKAFSGNGGTVDAGEYFKNALEWLEKRHGADNVVAANIQLDETTPHLVCYVVPLVHVEEKTRKRSVISGRNEDGTPRRELKEFVEPARTRLSAAHYQGTPAKLRALQSDFAADVGVRHNLARGQEGSKAHHTTIARWYGQVNDTDALQDRVKMAEERIEKILKGAKRLGQELVQHAPARAKEIGLIQGTSSTKQRDERSM